MLLIFLKERVERKRERMSVDISSLTGRPTHRELLFNAWLPVKIHTKHIFSSDHIVAQQYLEEDYEVP